MNIIFLDIDGVLMPLGSHEYLRSDAAALKAYYVTQDQRFAPVNAYDIAAVAVSYTHLDVYKRQRLTQYVSTDYQWHYYSYTVYEDAKCTKKVGSYTSQKWKDRYARKLMELGLSMLSLS